VFPGSSDLPAALTVGELLDRTAIDDLQILSGGSVDRGTTLVTRAHLRPTWTNGRLVLAVERAAGATLVPFETPNPTPCCADHV